MHKLESHCLFASIMRRPIHSTTCLQRIRNSSSVILPLASLARFQTHRRFEGSCEPPREVGTIWSISASWIEIARPLMPHCPVQSVSNSSFVTFLPNLGVSNNDLHRNGSSFIIRLM